MRSEPPTNDTQIAVKTRGLDAADEIVALTLRDKGVSYTQIADQLGHDRETVTRFLKNALSDDNARILLQSKRLQAIESWQVALSAGAAKGDHRPAKDLLLHTGVIEDKHQPTSNVAVQVVIGGPGAPAGPDPFDSRTQAIDSKGVSDAVIS